MVCPNAAFAFPVDGQLTATLRTPPAPHDVAVEHLTRTPYRVVTCGASTNVELSVQSRSSVSPASPTIPFVFPSVQNWYCTVPPLQALTLDPDACSVTSWPGPDNGGVGDAVKTAFAAVHDGQESPTNDALSTANTIGAARACSIRTSSMNQPSSPTTLSTANSSSQSCELPSSIELARNRIRIRRAENAERSNFGWTQVPGLRKPAAGFPCKPGPSLARPMLLTLKSRRQSVWPPRAKTNSGKQVDDGPRRRSGSVGLK